MSESLSITMRDIAQALGVSVPTVSRALKGSGRISADLRERICSYAREHNYYPNELAGSLRLSRIEPQRVIGVIVPQITHYYFSTILSGIEDEASSKGYRIMVAQSDESYEREVQICQSFLRNRVCGVIVSQAKDTRQYDHFRHLTDAGVPLVFYDRICTGLNTSRVVVDDYHGAFVAVSHLIETGCRRIAFYGSPMQLEISKNRYNGYRDALARHGIKADDSLKFECDNRADAEELTPEVLARDDHPDAFFAVNDDTHRQAPGLPRAGRRQHLRLHQRRTCHRVRTDAHHRRTAGRTRGPRSRQHPPRPRGETHRTRQSREARRQNPPHRARNDEGK